MLGTRMYVSKGGGAGHPGLVYCQRLVLCRATYPHLTDKIGLRAGPTYLLNPPRRASSLGPTYLPLAPQNKGVISAQPKLAVSAQGGGFR